MPPTPTPSLTSAAALYLCLADQAKSSSDALYVLYMSEESESEFARHVFNGCWSLKTDFERLILSLRDAGGLLFWCAPGVMDLAGARAFECSSPATQTAPASLPAPARAGQGEGTSCCTGKHCHVCPHCGAHDDCEHPCPICGDALQPCCHVPPDPMFFCDGCGGSFNADLSTWEEGK